MGSKLIVDLLGAFTIAEKARIQTVLRIVGRVGFFADAVNTEMFGRWGITPVTDIALANNIVPDPTGASDSEGRWMWNNVYLNRKTQIELTQDVVDIRSRHRFRANANTLALVVKNTGAAGQFFMGFRILYIVK